jgi:hypothetical protein
MKEEDEDAAFDDIMGLLQKARRKPFDDDEALRHRANVLRVVRFHKRDPQTLSGAEREHAKDIATAIGKARKAVEKALKLPNLTNALTGTWDMAEHYDEPVVYLRRTADFQTMLDGLAALEEVTRQVAAPRRRGRPRGTGVHSEPIIIALSQVYEKATGLEAKLGRGPFQRFVSAFTKCFVKPAFEDEAIIKAIQRTKHLKNQSLMPWRKAPLRK